MTLIDRRKRVPVRNIEVGQSCGGLHVNVVRPPSHEKVNGKVRPNPRSGQMLHNDGCFDPVAMVEVSDA
jgi:hypothetical protein